MNRSRITLVTIALLFLAPLVLALLMRSNWWDFKPAHLSNRGTLVAPGSVLGAEATQAANDHARQRAARAHWTILYRMPPVCAAECRRALTSLRQVHIATGRDRERVVIWLLHDTMPTAQAQDSVLSIHEDFEIRADMAGASQRLLASLEGEDGLAFGDAPGQVFLLDPANHIILRYAPGFDPRDLSQDLDRLLTWSPEEGSTPTDEAKE